MSITFSTSTKKGFHQVQLEGKTVQGVNGLLGFREIKLVDLRVGEEFGQQPRYPRDGVDPVTLTYTHADPQKRYRI